MKVTLCYFAGKKYNSTSRSQHVQAKLVTYMLRYFNYISIFSEVDTY